MDRTDTTDATVARQPVVVRRESYMSRFAGIYRDRVSWGAVWAGLLTALGLFVLLSVLATAIGITTIQATQADPNQVNRIAGLVSAVLALLAFFVGGLVAGGGAGTVGKDAGALNGFLVWALALVSMLLLAAFGLGQLFGALGGGFEMYRQFGTGQMDAQAAAQGIQTAAWITFISLALAATASTIGGLVGAQSDDDVDDRDAV